MIVASLCLAARMVCPGPGRGVALCIPWPTLSPVLSLNGGCALGSSLSVLGSLLQRCQINFWLVKPGCIECSNTGNDPTYSRLVCCKLHAHEA